MTKKEIYTSVRSALMQKNSFTYKLNPAQQKSLIALLQEGNYKPASVEYTSIAVEGPDCRIALYQSGKCLVQGKGAQEWISFVLEPEILKEVRLGYEDVVNEGLLAPHMGIDESGKGDFFGPLVVASVYTDAGITKALREIQVRDSKTISSDKKIFELAGSIRELTRGRFSVVTIGPEAYNRLYSSIKNVNKLLAWGHARAIENLLEKVPDCPEALSDKFGPERQIQMALMKKGKSIKLHQRTHAESDMAVAAASIIARAAFVQAMDEMGKRYLIKIPKGASVQVKDVAAELVKKHGPLILLKTCKCHFKTADDVLQGLGLKREVLGEHGAITSKSAREDHSKS